MILATGIDCYGATSDALYDALHDLPLAEAEGIDRSDATYVYGLARKAISRGLTPVLEYENNDHLSYYKEPTRRLVGIPTEL